MKLTAEHLIELGFVEYETYWIDSFQMMIYKDRLPDTLGGLVRMMTGTAHRKGYKKCLSESPEQRQATQDHFNRPYHNPTKFVNGHRWMES